MKHGPIIRAFKRQMRRTQNRNPGVYRFDRTSDWYWVHIPGRDNPYSIHISGLKMNAESMAKGKTFVEDTQEEKVKALHFYLKEAEKYNEWANKATEQLLTDIGPRIAALGKVLYMGCGFHYSKEQSIGKMLISLSIPWQPSMNHYEKCKDEFFSTMARKTIYECLVKDIIEAEKSVEKLDKR